MAANGKGRILIVDDDKEIRDILSKMLAHMDFEVALASDGSEALDLFLQNPFDLILTDLRMPRMDGWTLAFHVKSMSPDTPIVLMTGEEKNQIMPALEGSCVDIAMFKPFRLEEIEKTIQVTLKKRLTSDGDAHRLANSRT
jgi:two-component system response regulator PilR (NtrC family)